MDLSGKKKMKTNIKKLILLLITIVFLYFVFVNLDINELLSAIKGFNIKYAFFLAISILVSLSFRGLCFKQLISKSANLPLKDLVPLCISGAALNIVLPARAGDFFRAYYVGHKYAMDKVKVFGAIMLERIFDGLVILSMLFAGILLYNKNPLAQKLCIAASAIFFVALLLAFLAFKYNKTDSICKFFQDKTEFLPDTLKKMVH